MSQEAIAKAFTEAEEKGLIGLKSYYGHPIGQRKNPFDLTSPSAWHLSDGATNPSTSSEALMTYWPYVLGVDWRHLLCQRSVGLFQNTPQRRIQKRERICLKFGVLRLDCLISIIRSLPTSNHVPTFQVSVVCSPRLLLGYVYIAGSRGSFWSALPTVRLIVKLVYLARRKRLVLRADQLQEQKQRELWLM
eukprot:Blabericola_migrator_1__13256@NODE_923_length_6034_cov_34_268309_g642_i0_p2_GENE_NODE_923_length_6034_cov_34_268309_g642_i0NODE_923_length_6034_cov_34_268309_g642_i0_p2_ORF_typecomplete_len191_score10_46Lyase_8/PF02278_18/0_2_NODE_923_length_6034_cov_34_268309_g642_i048955467